MSNCANGCEVSVDIIYINNALIKCKLILCMKYSILTIDLAATKSSPSHLLAPQPQIVNGQVLLGWWYEWDSHGGKELLYTLYTPILQGKIDICARKCKYVDFTLYIGYIKYKNDSLAHFPSRRL